MGPYLPNPIKEKKKDDADCPLFHGRYATCSMQGWRKTMEDAHIAIPNLNGNSLFGVLDGHGGCEVAQYVSKTLPSIIKD